MKQKDIDKCQHINLSTEPKDIMQTMQLELPVVNYFFKKDYGGKNRLLKHEDELLDRALAEQQSQVTEISEWISHKGNRWLSYVFTEYFPKARYAQNWPTSFIYYETYGSCGAFFPMYRPSKKDKSGKITEIYGVIIYTSHFFQRMSERTGKAYRSRDLIQEFITTMQTRASQADEDGEVIIKFKGGYGFGVQRDNNPLTIEVRTFLADEQLTPSQRRKCEKVDAYAELIADGKFLKEVAVGNAYYSTETFEKKIEQAEHNFMLSRKLGIDRLQFMSGLVNTTFIMLMVKILKIDYRSITEAQLVAISSQIEDYYEEFVNRYLHYDGKKASDTERSQFRSDLINLMVKCARRLKLRSMTHEAISKHIDQCATWGDTFAEAYEKMDQQLKYEQDSIH